MEVWKIAKVALLWMLIAFILLLMLGGMSWVFGLLLILLIVPIKKWQDLQRRYVKKWIRVVAIILSVILMVAFTSTDNQPDESGTGGSFSSDTVSSEPVSSDVASSETKEDSDTSSEEDTDNSSEESDISSTVNSTPVTSSQPTSSSRPVTSSQPSVSSSPAVSSQPSVSSNPMESSQPAHVHSFAVATCTSPKKCSCGETQGDAMGHSYSNGQCTRCGANDPDYTEVTYVLNTHTFKFHYLGCRGLPTTNRLDTTMSREEIIAQGYEPCGICDP